MPVTARMPATARMPVTDQSQLNSCTRSVGPLTSLVVIEDKPEQCQRYDFSSTFLIFQVYVY